MSKSFRNRPVDYTKSLPIYMNDELPDIADYTAINRSVPQMPSGMEKEEEAEHHLQRALSAQTVYGSSSSSDYAIPTPKVKPVDSEKYDRIYAAECPKYTTYIRLQPFGNDIEYPEYDCDTEDETWLASNSSVTVDTFEDIMDRLEKATGYSTNLMTNDEAKLLFNKDEIDANVLTSVYEYWRAKRLRLKHPLTPTVLTDKSGMTTQPNNPYLVFRRRTEKMQTRKNRKNEEQSYEKMLILKRDLMRAQSLFNLIKKRESFKKDYLKLVMEIFEKRYKANDFDGTLTADHQMMPHATKQVSVTSHLHHPANASSIASSSSSSHNQRQFLASNSNQNHKPALLHHHPHHLSNKSNKQNASNMLKKKALVTHKSSSHYSSSISHPHSHHTASNKSNKKSSQVSSMPLAKGSLCQSSSSSSSSSSTCSTISAIASTHLAAPTSISLATNDAKSPHKRLSRDTDQHHQANSAHMGVSATSERLTPNELENIEALLNETMNALSTSVESDGYWVFRRKEGCNYLAPQQKPLLQSSTNNKSEQKMRSDCGSDAKWGYVRTSRNRHLGLVRRRLGRGGRVILDRFDAAVNATPVNCLKFDSYRANNRPIDHDENEDDDATTCDYTYFNMQLQQLKSNSNTIGSSRCINNSNVNGRVVRMHRHHPYYNDAICNRRQWQHDEDLSAFDDEYDDNYELLKCGDDDMDEDDDEQNDSNQSDEDSHCDDDKNKDERDTNKRANDGDNHNNDEKLDENNFDMNENNEEVVSNNNNDNNSHNSNSNGNNNNNSGDDINNNSMMNSNLNTTIDEAMVPQQQQQNNNSDLNDNKLKSCNLYAAYRSFSDEYRSEASECVLDKISVRHALASLHHHKTSSVSLYSQAANIAQTKPTKVVFHTNNENSNLDENETSSLSAVKLLATNSANGNIYANSNGVSSNGNVLSHITLNNTPANAITVNTMNITNNIQLNTSTNMNSNNLNSNLNVNSTLSGAASSPIVNIVNLNSHSKLSATKKSAAAINLLPNGNNATSPLLANVPIKLIANSTANSNSSSSAITGTVSNSSINVSVNGGSTGAQVTSQSTPNGLNILSLANGAVKKDLDHENTNTPNSFKVASSAVHVNLNGSSTVPTAVATSSVKKISQQQQHHQKLYHFGQGVTTSSPVVNSNTFNVVYKMPIAANHHHHHHHHHTDSQTSTSKIL